MNLVEAIERIDEFDEDQTIYVSDSGAVTGQSEVVVDFEDDNGEPPSSANGFRYLLEVSLVKDAIRVWQQWRNGADPSPEDKLNAATYYAENDAFIPAD